MSFSNEERYQLLKLLNSKKIPYKLGWKNYMGTVANPGATVIEVDSQGDLCAVIKKIKTLNNRKTRQNKITVRATAGWADNTGNSCLFFPWKKVQESEYNEGYSFSQVVGGRTNSNDSGTDIIIRFGKSFHKTKVLGKIDNPSNINPNNPIHKLPHHLVEVSAGVSIAALSSFLRSHNLSLTTVSMIAWVTAVGLAGTAGHGTGRDEPGFSGLIEAITICDMDGNIRELTREHPDFADLVGGHSGLLGIVLSMKIRTVQAFNLCETVSVFAEPKEMRGKLSDILKNNQYVSIMAMDSGLNSLASQAINKWQILKWNYTTEKPTSNDKPTYAATSQSFVQELEVRVGASIMEYLVDSGLNHLLPYFMLMSASSVIGSRGIKPRVDFENNITHPQVAFPKKMRDVSYIIPVKDEAAGTTLEMILEQVNALLVAAAKRGECPITYSLYVRYIKGTNGGLSTSATASADEHVLAIDIVTHPNAPGIQRFEQEFVAFLKGQKLSVRHHLGKNFPAGIEHYDQFLGAKAVTQFQQAMIRWHNSPGNTDGAERFANSPFNNTYMQQMLSPSAVARLLKAKPMVAQPVIKTASVTNKFTSEQHTDFLSRLHTEVSKLPVYDAQTYDAKNTFLNLCAEELDKRYKNQNLPINAA